MPRSARTRKNRRRRDNKRSNNSHQNGEDRQRRSAKEHDEDLSDVDSVTKDDDRERLHENTTVQTIDNKNDALEKDEDKIKVPDGESSIESSSESLIEAKVNGHAVKVTTEESTSTRIDGNARRGEFRGRRETGSIFVKQGATAAVAAARRRLRVERRAMNTETKICEITSVSGLPMAASIGHVAGVGILETGNMMGKEKIDDSIVTISEPLEPVEPLPCNVASKVETMFLGQPDFSMALLASVRNNKRDGPEIREVSDSDADTDNSSRPSTAATFIVEAESDIEKDCALDQRCHESIAEEVEESEDGIALEDIEIPGDICSVVDIDKKYFQGEGEKIEEKSKTVDEDPVCDFGKVDSTEVTDQQCEETILETEEDEDTEYAGDRSSSVEDDSLEEECDHVAKPTETGVKVAEKTTPVQEVEKSIQPDDSFESPVITEQSKSPVNKEITAEESENDMEALKNILQSKNREATENCIEPTVCAIPEKVKKCMVSAENSVTEEVENKLRLFIEGLELPSFHEDLHAIENRGFEIEREANESSSRRRAKKKAILESYYAEAKHADRFLDIIQEEGDAKLSEGDEQHIRDFINEEIGKFRREKRKVEINETSEVNTKEQTIKQSEKPNSSDTTKTTLLSTKETRIQITKTSTSDEETNKTQRNRQSSGNSSSQIEISENGVSKGNNYTGCSEREPPVPPMRLSSFVTENEPLRPPTPPDIDYPTLDLPNVPAIPEDVMLTLQRPPVPPLRRKNLNYANLNNISPRRPPLPEELTGKNDRIYENVDYSRRIVNSNSGQTGQAPPPLPPLPRELQAFENDYNSTNGAIDNSYQPEAVQDVYSQYYYEDDTINDNWRMASSSETSRVNSCDEHTLRNLQAVNEKAHFGRCVTGNDASLEIASSAGNHVYNEDLAMMRSEQQPQKIITTDFGHSTLASRTEQCTAGDISSIRKNKQRRNIAGDNVKVESSSIERSSENSVTSDATSEDREVKKSKVDGGETKEKCQGKERFVPMDKTWENKQIYKVIENSEKSEYHHEVQKVYENVSSILEETASNYESPSSGSSAKNSATVISKAQKNFINVPTHLNTTSDSRDVVENNRAEAPRHKQQQSSSTRLSENTGVEAVCSSDGRINSGTVANKNSGDDSHPALPRVILAIKTDLLSRQSSSNHNEDADNPESSSSGAASPNTVRFNPTASSYTDLSYFGIREELERSDQYSSKKPVDDLDLYYVPLQDATSSSPAESKKFEDCRPDLLKDLCIRKILSLPYGPQIINEITLPKFNIFKNLKTIHECISSVVNNQPDYSDTEESKLGSDKETSFLSEMKKQRPKTWMGMPTIDDPKLLLCLSPSQQDEVRTSADNLLDLHKKFINRRSYHEDRREEVKVPRYRIQLGPEDGFLNESGQGENDRVQEIRKTVGPANRLLEIIKENPIASSDKIFLEHTEKTTKNTCQKNNESLTNGSKDFRQDRLRATRLSDWLSLARQDPLDYALHVSFNESADSSIKNERGYESESEISKRSSNATRGSSVQASSLNSTTRDNVINNECLTAAEDARSQGRNLSPNESGTTVAANASYAELFDEYTRRFISEMENGAEQDQERELIGKRFGETVGHRVNSALIVRSDPGSDADQHPATVRSSTPAHHFDKNPISIKSAIIDKSPVLSNEAMRKRIPKMGSPKGTIDSRHNVNPALIDNGSRQEKSPGLKTRRAVVVDRSCIDTTSIFDKTPPRCHLEPRKYQDPEALKTQTASEIIENLKRLQNSAREHQQENLRGNQDRRYSLPQEYFERQLDYIEQLENQLKEVIIAEEEEKRAYEEFQGQVNRDRVRSMIELSDRQFRPNVNESWHDESRTQDSDRSEFIKKEGHREETRSVSNDGSLRVENSATSYENVEEKLVNSGMKKVNGTSSSMGSEWKSFFEDTEGFPNGFGNEETGESLARTLLRDKSSTAVKPIIDFETLPTNGEVFRRKMYDEYLHKVLEREERKQHKVIKISSHPDLDKVPNSMKSPVETGMTKMEKEFIERARNRMSRFGINLDSGSESETTGANEKVKGDDVGRNRKNTSIISKVQNSTENAAKCLIDGCEIKDAKCLPKHLQEFLELATTADIEDGE